MVSIKKRIVALLVSITVLLGQLSFMALADSTIYMSEDEALLMADAKDLYEKCHFLLYDDLAKNPICLEDGLTVILGREISLNNIFEDKGLASNINSFRESSLNNTSEKEKTVYCDTYMVLLMKNGKRIDVNYVSVEYESDVNIETIDKFVAAEHSAYAIESRVKEFINTQITTEASAYNSIDNATDGTTSRQSAATQVVLSVRDTGYYVANYVTTGTSLIPSASYPVMIYKKDITYQAISVANSLPDSELYVIYAFVNVTPGNCLDSVSAAENTSLNAADLYNTQYKNAISIKAVKTSFENMYPQYDYFIDMSPRNSLSDVEGLTIPVSLGVPSSISTTFNVVVASEPRTDMTVVFDPDGTSSVKFEAYKVNSLFPIEPCMITEPFSYKAGVYMESGGQVLSMNVATTIKYYFINKGENAAIWAGSEREMYYDSRE